MLSNIASKMPALTKITKNLTNSLAPKKLRRERESKVNKIQNKNYFLIGRSKLSKGLYFFVAPGF
jgi:hypothetical protein